MTTMNCVDFSKSPNGASFGMEFVSGQFKFTALDDHLPVVVPDNTQHPPGGLQFGPAGLQIDLSVPASNIVIKGVTGAPFPLKATAFNHRGKPVDNTIISYGEVKSRSLRSELITSIIISNNSYEGILISICIEPVDPKMLVEEALKKAKEEGGEIGKYLEDPIADGLIEKALGDYKGIYKEEEKDPIGVGPVPIVGGDPGGGDPGGGDPGGGDPGGADPGGGDPGGADPGGGDPGGGFKLNWNINLDCIFGGGLMYAVGVTTFLFVTFGPQIAVGKALAIEALVGTFGISTALATYITNAALAENILGISERICEANA